MIKQIAHLGDIHIRLSISRNEEYLQVFDNLYKSLKKEKPDRIVIVGDINNDYINLQGEQLIIMSNFLEKLSEIAPLVITRGNHDFVKKSPKRVDSIEAVTKVLKNKNIHYLNETKMFEDDNIIWAVWKHGDYKSPWKKGLKRIEDKTYIDLYHDPIYSSIGASGFEFKSSNLTKLSNFKGDYSLFADIHLKQYFTNKTKAYCGSLIAQDYSEGDDQFHGYLMWNIESSNVEEFEIENKYSFKTIKVTSFTDFDDLDIEIENPTEFMRIRVIWNCLPNTRTTENERKIKEYLNKEYKNIIRLSNKNEFLEEDSVDVINDKQLDNIMLPEVQQNIFKEYFEKIGVEKEVIDGVLKLDNEITERIIVDNFTSIEWDIIKVWGENLFSYENFEIDWNVMDGMTQIVGENTGGKTTLLFKNLLYVLYGKTPETEMTEKNGDSRYVNNANGASYCIGGVILEANNIYYGIVRKTVIEKNKRGELKSSPTTVDYYLLNSPDDDLTDENRIENLTEERKHKTQTQLNKVIGSYENFIRTVMTTSDSLNGILSSKQAEFTDSLLLDSGLNIFDIKLTEYKEFLKEKNTTPRIICDITKTKEKIDKTILENEEIFKKTNNIKEIKIPEINKRVSAGELFINNEIKKIFKIDDNVAKLNIEDTKKNIAQNEIEKSKLIEKKERIVKERDLLLNKYDEKKLETLLLKKDQHNKIENDRKILIKNYERQVIEEQHKIEIINGKIFLLENEGKKLKENIISLKNSKTCPTCKQLVSKDAQQHIKLEIDNLLVETKKIIVNINENKEIITSKHNPIIKKINDDINNTKILINDTSIEMTKVLDEIGNLTDQKNEVEKRTGLDNQINVIPVQIENYDLKIKSDNDLIDRNIASKQQITQNIITNRSIDKGNELLKKLRAELLNLNETISIDNNSIINNNLDIENSKNLIISYKEQIKIDNVRELYKKSIHRTGIPTQLLTSKIIPKVNNVMNNLLNELDFSVWIDKVDLRLKLAYNNSDTFINAISGSGKERTFSSIVLKFALNEINLKSKPKMMLLDEMMGKLTGDSIEEFIKLLGVIKTKLKKLIIIEHNHELNPDHIISVKRGETGISQYEII
jgi:hypothetical protein